MGALAMARIQAYVPAMAMITFIEPQGRRHDVSVTPGASLMEAARQAKVPGLPADCGGACACATCHAYVEESWAAKLPPAGDMEEDMLDFAEARDPSRSRLTCQVIVTEEMDGLTLSVPEGQI